MTKRDQEEEDKKPAAKRQRNNSSDSSSASSSSSSSSASAVPSSSSSSSPSSESDSETSEYTYCFCCKKDFSEEVKRAQCIGSGKAGEPRCDEFDGKCEHCLANRVVGGGARVCQLCHKAACSPHRTSQYWWECGGCDIELCGDCCVADNRKPMRKRYAKTCVANNSGYSCLGEFCSSNCDHGKEDEKGNPVCENCDIPPTEAQQREMEEDNRALLLSYVEEAQRGHSSEDDYDY